MSTLAAYSREFMQVFTLRFPHSRRKEPLFATQAGPFLSAFRRSGYPGPAAPIGYASSIALLLVALLFAPRVSAMNQDAPPGNAAAKPAATQPAAASPASQPASPKVPAAASPAPQAAAPASDGKTPAAAGPNAQPQNEHQLRDNYLIHSFCALAVLLVLYPIGRFLLRPWSFRREKLLGALAGDAIVHYYIQFRAGAQVLRKFPPTESAEPVNGCIFPTAVSDAYLASFRNDFSRWYGRRYYIAPVLMLTLLSTASGWWADEMIRTWASNGTGPGTDLRALVASALAGAFVWVISDALDRLRTRDFVSVDVWYLVFRILLAVPFAWALSLLAPNADAKIFGVPASIPLAFFLGSFPTQTLFTIARRIGSQQLHLGDDQETGNLELEKLQSIGKSNAERFKDEGITTITTLAYADPIDLTIRTNFDFSYVVDCVSQALTWIYFGDAGAQLFGYSLRGAQEIVSVVLTADNDEDPRQARAQQTIIEAAQKLNIPPEAFRSSLDQIADDPYTKFLVNVWR